MTTFSDLLEDLQTSDPTQPLIFATDDGEIGAGYHVTELRHSTSTGIDCGGQIESWQETRLQLLDAQGVTHMSVGKFRSILHKSLSALPELANAPLLVEFGHNNSALALKTVKKPIVLDGAVIVGLGEARAVCKPAQRRSNSHTQSTLACCGSVERNVQNTSCCTSDGQLSEAEKCCA